MPVLWIKESRLRKEAGQFCLSSVWHLEVLSFNERKGRSSTPRFIGVLSCAVSRYKPYELPCLGMSCGGGEQSLLEQLCQTQVNLISRQDHLMKRRGKGKEGKVIPRNCLLISFWLGNNYIIFSLFFFFFHFKLRFTTYDVTKLATL